MKQTTPVIPEYKCILVLYTLILDVDVEGVLCILLYVDVGGVFFPLRKCQTEINDVQRLKAAVKTPPKPKQNKKH